MKKYQTASPGAQLTEVYSYYVEHKLIRKEITVNDHILSYFEYGNWQATVLPGDSMAKACWTLLRIPAELVQLVQLGYSFGIQLEKDLGSFHLEYQEMQ